MERISKLSQWMQRVCLAFGLFLVISELAIWLFFETMVPFSETLSNIPNLASPMGWKNLLGGFVVSGGLTALLVYALYRLWRLFGVYRLGQIFSAEAVEHLYRFARALLLYAVLSIPGETLLVLALTISNPPGERLLSFGVNLFEISMLVLGGAFLVISWVMREAGRMAEENAQII